MTHELAEQLWNAGAWLDLVADRLEDGKVEDARNMTALGMALCEPLPRQVAELAHTMS